MEKEALALAIEIAGGKAALADLIGVTRQAVVQWRRVPADRVIAVEKATRGRVKRHQLRPDIYPPPAPRAKVQRESVRA